MPPDALKDKVQFPGGCWPTAQQERLLHAALDQDTSALGAWAAWRADANIDALDQGSYRLLPLAYRNLACLGANDALMPRLKGIYRRAWYENHMLFHKRAALLSAFAATGIPTLLLKGAAVAPVYYRDYGLRPLGDFDFLVPTAQAHAALRLLDGLGFRSSERRTQTFKPVYLAAVHGFPFADTEGREIDLHWHALAESCEPDADADFWAAAQPLTLEATTTLTLSPADQLLHTCVHGVRWNPIPPMRWVADAMTILRAAPNLDWERLVEQTRRRRLVIQMREALGYLARAFAAPVPAPILARLQTLPVSRSERREYDVLTQPQEGQPALRRVWLHYRRYVRSTRPAHLWEQPMGFARFLQYTWGLESMADIPAYVARGGASARHSAATGPTVNMTRTAEPLLQ